MMFIAVILSLVGFTLAAPPLSRCGISLAIGSSAGNWTTSCKIATSTQAGGHGEGPPLVFDGYCPGSDVTASVRPSVY